MRAGTVSGGVHFHGAAAFGNPAAGPVPRQLPSGIPHFVNRGAELERLDAMLAPAEGDQPFAVPVCLITGTAGGGKTSLALRWAHRVREHFPDGQLHINLRGYDPGEPVAASEALHRFLGALGVRPEGVPADQDAAAALYRSLLADRRMLILLDNAATVAQVRPLLPGTASCLTLITSRSRLPGLAIRDGARRITLGTLPEEEAVALLRAVTAEHRPEDTPEEPAEGQRAALRRLVDWYLGLAVAAARWLSPTEEWAAPEPAEAAVATALAESGFADYDAATDFVEREFPNLVATVPLTARLERPDLGWRLAAVLWDAQPPSTGTLLWPPAGRAGLELARVARARDGQAMLLTDLGMAHVGQNELAEAVARYREALALWRDLGDRAGIADVQSLLGLVHLRRRELREAAASFDEAHAVFRAVGPPHRAATVLANVATVRLRAGELLAAREAAERALREHRALGDRRGEGNASHVLSEALREQGETAAALDAARWAVGIALDLRDLRPEGYWLLTLGAAQLAAGEPAEALVSYQRSAAPHRRYGDRGREALAWQGAGEVYRRLGRTAEAVDFLRRAAAAQRELGDGWHAALALAALADALDGTDAAAAGERRAEALRLMGDANDARALALRERLRRAGG
nr:tetratricopeptide repeat protein [Streptomyces triticirhizae]